MKKLIEAIEQLEALKGANAKFFYILAAEDYIQYQARLVRNRVLIYARLGDTWNGMNPKVCQ